LVGDLRVCRFLWFFALTFISIFPVDIYGAYTCHASSGQARIGGAGVGDSLLHTPLSLSVIHSLIYYFCERDEKRGQVPLAIFCGGNGRSRASESPALAVKKRQRPGLAMTRQGARG
jgi:hypothetical protein